MPTLLEEDDGTMMSSVSSELPMHDTRLFPSTIRQGTNGTATGSPTSNRKQDSGGAFLVLMVASKIINYFVERIVGGRTKHTTAYTQNNNMPEKFGRGRGTMATCVSFPLFSFLLASCWTYHMLWWW